MAIDLNGIFTEDKPRRADPFANQLNNFPIVIHHHQRYVRSSFHSQPGIEVHFTHEGSGVLLVGKKPLLQIPRQVVIFRASVPHQLTLDPSTPCSRTVLCINDAKIPGTDYFNLTDLSWMMTDDCINFTLPPGAYAQIDELNRNLAQELKRKQQGWEQMACSYMLNIMVRLRRMASTKQPLQTQTQKESITNRVQQCLDYIRENLNGDLTLSHVSSIFSISSEHLTRIFSKEHGISYYQFVLLNRISEAKRLLQTAPQMTIIDIAFTVGFESSGQLSRTFRKFTNETPASYRKRVCHYDNQSG